MHARFTKPVFFLFASMLITGLLAVPHGLVPALGSLLSNFGVLNVMPAWIVFIMGFAATSRAGKLLDIVSGVLGLDASLAFVPALLSLIVAFLPGGLGSLTGGYITKSTGN